MYARKKILAPLVLQPAPSLVRTSLRQCSAIADTCERCLHTATAYGAMAAWGAEQSGTQCVGAHAAWAHTRRAPTARPIKANYLKIVALIY